MVGLVLSVATVGCVKTDDPSANQSGMVTLQLSNGTLTTRAVGTNDNTNNEDLIADAQVFFFNSNADNATVKYSYYTDITDTKESATLSIPLTAEQLTSLFPGGNGYVYVIANYGSEITGATTLAALKTTAIASTFGTDEDGVQPSFFMDSDLTPVARGTANTITGEVFLTRAAAKIELTVNVAPITQDGKQWIADTADMRLSFNNGVSNGVIDDGSDEEGVEPAAGGTTFDIAGRGFTRVTGDEGNGSFVQSVPFYSYSTKWAAGTENEVYLELAIPWAVKTEGDTDPTYQTFYYQVPVSADALTLVRNAYYKLTLDVGVLGGLTKPVTVVPSYVVLNWGTNNVNVTLSRPKYLVVDENYVVLDNLETYSVGYQASDEVVITEVGNHTFQTIYSSRIDAWDAVYDFSVANNISAANGAITFSHQLDNTREANGSSDPAERYDYQSNTVTIKVSLKDDPSIYETITFVQKPAMTVESLYQSSSSVMINGQDDQSTSNWWHVAGTLGTRNTVFRTEDSKNIYAVSVSAFDASTSNYIICDPRLPAEDLELHTVSESNRNGTGQILGDRATYSDAAGNNEIKGYRGTIIEDSRYLVAPQFIMASGFGSHSLQTKVWPETTGKYRCASYQEAGYPAGRWRLPTPAELEVIGKMCSEGKIGSIFNETTVYASSDGGYRYDDGSFYKPSDNPVATSVRCVYDIWYWKDKCKSNTQFIWGTEENIADMKAKGTYDTYMTSVE